MVIIGDNICLGGEKSICGAVTVENGRIVKIDEFPPEKLAETAHDINAVGKTISPGFIDAHTHLGLFGSGIGIEGDDLNEDSDPVTPHLRALDAIDPFDSAFSSAYCHGITTVITGSGSANAIGGDIVAMKTVGTIADEMVIKTVGIKFALGENPKAIHGDKDSMPVTRMGIAALIREALYKAKRYKEDVEAAKSDPEIDRPEYDIKSEALIPLLEGKIKAHFHCHKANDIVTAVRISKEFNIPYTLIHCTEGYKIAEFLAKNNATAVIGPIISSKCKPELAGVTEQNAGLMQKQGVTVAIGTDYPEIPEYYLHLSAMIAGQNGLTHPLDAITQSAAKIAGIDDRVGYIREGYDADIVILDKDRVITTIINGEVVFDDDDNKK
ncbi:MAG: amidohydrolase family protein [Ruminococcus sp.]|jgi:imidazolonepropionase-like amidohydrolase|nr:amidohydrolase family protein [Ruminococcus sp.]